MESTSEVVWKEQTKSSVSKKSVQEVSATSVQKLSSSALTGEKSMLSILEADGGLIGNQMASDSLEMAAIPATLSSLSLSSPIITSPSLPEEDNAINTSSLQSEFSAMKLKDEHGNEIGEIVQEKQQQQSVKASSSSVTSADGGSKSTSSVSKVSSSTTSSSLIQQSATSLLAEAQESSSSVSCSSFTSTKKQEVVSSSTRSLSSIKSSQSIEKVMKSSTAIVEDQEF